MRRRTAAPARPEAPRPESVPRQRERPRPETRPPLPGLPAGPAELPKKLPVSRTDVCDLGERYGGWAPGSDPSRICHGTYGR
ncbi:MULTISPECIES: hypothetical protein [unclassified Streptomyces]|nr:hypothetical protein [Streptomyces sp. CB02980]MCB8904355.1 hypothetical protein [Streptomyces sp. CB02980]